MNLIDLFKTLSSDLNKFVKAVNKYQVNVVYAMPNQAIAGLTIVVGIDDFDSEFSLDKSISLDLDLACIVQSKEGRNVERAIDIMSNETYGIPKFFKDLESIDVNGKTVGLSARVLPLSTRILASENVYICRRIARIYN